MKMGPIWHRKTNEDRVAVVGENFEIFSETRIFSRILGARKMKNGSLFMHQKMASPLTPVVPLRQSFFVKRKFYDLTKLSIYDVSNAGN